MDRIIEHVGWGPAIIMMGVGILMMGVGWSKMQRSRSKKGGKPKLNPAIVNEEAVISVVEEFLRHRDDLHMETNRHGTRSTLFVVLNTMIGKLTGHWYRLTFKNAPDLYIEIKHKEERDSSGRRGAIIEIKTCVPPDQHLMKISLPYLGEVGHGYLRNYKESQWQQTHCAIIDLFDLLLERAFDTLNRQKQEEKSEAKEEKNEAKQAKRQCQAIGDAAVKNLRIALRSAREQQIADAVDQMYEKLYAGKIDVSVAIEWCHEIETEYPASQAKIDVLLHVLEYGSDIPELMGNARIFGLWAGWKIEKEST